MAVLLKLNLKISLRVHIPQVLLDSFEHYISRFEFFETVLVINCLKESRNTFVYKYCQNKIVKLTKKVSFNLFFCRKKFSHNSCGSHMSHWIDKKIS